MDGVLPIQRRIESVRIHGFRSIAHAELLDLPQAAVLIGMNGSGKSNVLRFLEMPGRAMSWLSSQARLGTPGDFAEFVERQGGADDQLFRGAHVTNRMGGEIGMRIGGVRHGYRFELSITDDDRLVFGGEWLQGGPAGAADGGWKSLGRGHRESALPEETAAGNTNAAMVKQVLSDCAVYRFRNISERPGRPWDEDDHGQLRPDGSNLASVLHWLQRFQPRRYGLLQQQIERILPAFGGFDIEARYGRVRLRWRDRASDKTFGTHLTSDGSLQFFALATLLHLPHEALPDVILLDDPELGLHPAAVSLLGGMIRSLSSERQIIVATQSPLLVDEFDPEQVYAMDQTYDGTTIRRMDRPEFKEWVDSGRYTTGEIWQQNLMDSLP